MGKVNKINNNNNIKEQINDIIELYNNINNNKMITKEIIKKEKTNMPEQTGTTKNNNEDKNKFQKEADTNEIRMIYNVVKQNKIRILGETFVKNNRGKCQIIVEGVTKELTEYIELNKEQTSKQTLELKLNNIKNITNMSCIFSGCSSLNNLPDISKWNTQNVTDMSCMFYGCSSLNNLPDISKWNTTKLAYYDKMFNKCSKLKVIPKIK